ncbi:MAG: sialidase family protein [Thermoprotei archaeon]|nr:sialidase family protein [Thermoprotei archaeon]
MEITLFNLRVKALGFILVLIMFASLLAAPVTVYASGRPTFEGERGALQFNVKDWRFTLSGPLSSYLLNYTFEPKPLSSLQDLSLTLGSTIAGTQTPTQPATTFTSNVRVTRDIYFYENEPSIAVNPLNSDNLVVATHQYTPMTVFVAAYFSEDGGDSWEGPILLPLAKKDDFLASDPGAASSPDGVFYTSYLSLGLRFITVGERIVQVLASDIVVARSVDGGKSWVTTIASTPERMKFEIPWHYSIWVVLLDKPYIAAGPPNTVVVPYTEFVYGYNFLEGREFLNITIKAVVSRDGGLTWSEPLKISPTVDYYADGRVLQGPYPAVGPDGTVYVAYYDSGPDGWLTGSAFIAFSRLFPDSLNFTEPSIVAEIPYEVGFFSPYTDFRWWSLMFPVPATSKDAVYIVYAGALKLGGMPKVFITKSTDRGLTWSQPKLVSPEGGAQFFPWIAVGPDGAVHVI